MRQIKKQIPKRETVGIFRIKRIGRMRAAKSRARADVVIAADQRRKNSIKMQIIPPKIQQLSLPR